MKLRKRLDGRIIFTVVVSLAFLVYLVIGLQPAEASDYMIDSRLEIPEIGLESDVTRLTRNSGKLDTPEKIVGSYSEKENKTLLIGHSTTVFTDLDKLKLGDEINYDGKSYKITNIRVVKKELISMREVLSASSEETITLMTCAGTLVGDGDATHRLIINAARI